MRDDRGTFRLLLSRSQELRAAARDVVELFEARFSQMVEPGDVVYEPLEWPAELPVGRLRERPSSKSSRCRLAGCKGDLELRVYETKADKKRGVERDSWTLCFEHALHWRDFSQETHESRPPGGARLP